jgi:hypothetical protein
MSGATTAVLSKIVAKKPVNLAPININLPIHQPLSLLSGQGQRIITTKDNIIQDDFVLFDDNGDIDTGENYTNPFMLDTDYIELPSPPPALTTPTFTPMTVDQKKRQDDYYSKKDNSASGKKKQIHRRHLKFFIVAQWDNSRGNPTRLNQLELNKKMLEIYQILPKSTEGEKIKWDPSAKPLDGDKMAFLFSTNFYKSSPPFDKNEFQAKLVPLLNCASIKTFKIIKTSSETLETILNERY